MEIKKLTKNEYAGQKFTLRYTIQVRVRRASLPVR
jgi:hypothetical protein